MEPKELKKLISQMTLDEKAGLCSGADFWSTKGIERLGIPSVTVSDGPHGLRKQKDAADHLGINESIKAVCFPAGCAVAASFSREMARLLGETLGEECQAEDVSVILGPAMNIKRSPLCGRNFEYYSEDPLVSSEMATAYINGVQSKYVGTSPKHFMANNQEYHRMTSSSIMDERTMREIYLASFESMVKKSKPWTIMNSYNRLNGTYMCENQEMLTDVLRNQWGFDGYVMTDWGAMNERVAALKAGCELEMPSSAGVTDAEIVSAVKSGELDEKVLDEAVFRILNITYRYLENRDGKAVLNLYSGHDIARKIEEESIVLLKNEENILPLSKKMKVAFMGKYASNPRYQGGGSSHINSFRVESAVEASDENEQIIYAQGYDDALDEINEQMQKEAIEAAKNAEVAVVFAGLPDSFESEGYDRKHLRMPKCQNRLIEEIAAVQPNVVVVLHNGAPIEMPWIDQVKGVLEVYLGGQAVGRATWNVLYGEVNPSGRLPETFPLRLQDTPCYLYYGGENDESEYREGVFVGYRYYTSKSIEVLFPFGYGLSYTTFTYSNLKFDKTSMKSSEKLKVTVDVTNTGERTGKEVVQLYVSAKESNVIRPVRELRAFEKVELCPQETKQVVFELDVRAFAYWDVRIHDWYAETGEYEIQLGKDASHMIVYGNIHLEAEGNIPKVYTLNSTLGEIMADSKGRAVFGKIMGSIMGGNTEETQMKSDSQGEGMMNQEMFTAMMEGMPLRQMLSFIPGIQKETILELIDALNG
ncbi:hypothetical protein C808_02551 [Lachnospiraceae bacterium M18-1]|nr:hypothetical protein C808_02551 [Lachnospiraceae bacterium M18-1]